MHQLRGIVIATLALAIIAAPAAAQDQYRHGNRAVVTPSNGRLVGELLARLYALPVPENPALGNGDHCLRLAATIVDAVEGGPCTIQRGTADMIGLGGAWSNVEPPFPATAEAQRAVVIAADRAHFQQIHLSIDGSAPINIRVPRFETVSPQQTVDLPEDNLVGAPPQTVTLVAHGWFVLIRNLGVGSHAIVQDAILDTGDHQTLTYIINVTRRRGGDQAHADPRRL